MLVATFNAATGWAGRRITWEQERFILDGHGPVTAADVLEYDRLGYLDWPSEEMRTWVSARLSWEQAVLASAGISPAEPVVAPVAADAAAMEPVGTPEAGASVVAPASGEPMAAPGEPLAATGEPGAAAGAPVVAEGPADVVDVLAPAGDVVDVVGESSYQDALRDLAGDPSETTADVEKWAYLIPEPANPYDRNAVAVYVDGRKVGYLPREDSPAYAGLLGRLWADHHARAVCRAMIRGGRHVVSNQFGGESQVEADQFGVKLALAVPARFVVTPELTVLTPDDLAAGPPPL